MGMNIIKKLAFQPAYEITHDWLMQVSQVNPRGISQFAEVLGVPEESFREQARMNKKASSIDIKPF